MNSWLLTGEEEQSELAVADYGGCHGRNCIGERRSRSQTYDTPLANKSPVINWNLTPVCPSFSTIFSGLPELFRSNAGSGVASPQLKDKACQRKLSSPWAI